MQESPALDVMLLLQRRGGLVTYSDPHVPVLRLEGLDLADCVVIVTDHSSFDTRPWWNARL
jgi:UDP-N-acetyl-D-glucosamine dehydrogenase